MMDEQDKLTEAARFGDIKLLHEIIRRNPDVLRRIDETPFLDTPLHVAASGGQVLGLLANLAEENERHLQITVQGSGFSSVVFGITDPFVRYLRPNQKLMLDAYEGDVNGLYSSLADDPDLLDRIDKVPFVDTPLHIAASTGKTLFVIEMMKLKPSFARKINPEGFSPLHCAAQTGNVELLGTFLAASPKSMEDVTVRGEAALTVALKNGKIEAFEFLVGWIFLGYDQSRRWKKNIVCFEDDDGQTVVQHYHSTPSHKPQVLGLLENLAEEDERYLQIIVQGFGFNSAVFGITDPFVCYLRPDKKLMLAAYEGDINGLYSSLADDPDLLDRIDKVPFVDTPLHIAASTGKTLFALELMRLKPSFARKINPEGHSPLHLAVGNSKFDTLLRLVDMDNDLVRVKGKDGKTPFHCTVERGSPDHIACLLLACPLSIIDLTDRKETAVHLAVKINRLEALEVLYGWLVRARKKEILTWTDDEGNNAWSIAEARNNDMVKKLLSESKWAIAWRAPAFSRLDREKDLGNSEARVTSFYGGASLGDYLRRKVSSHAAFFLPVQDQTLILAPESREAIVVVLALIATVTYQAVLSPPGGVLQGDPTLLFEVSSNGGNATSSLSSGALGLVGQTVMRAFPRYLFFVFNTTAFCLSMSFICSLLPQGQIFSFLAKVPLFLCYMTSSYVIGYRSVGWWIFMAYLLRQPISTMLQLFCSAPKFPKRVSLF